MTVSQVVEDIIRKVSEGQAGTWQYTYRRADSANGEILDEERYELVFQNILTHRELLIQMRL